MNDQAVEPNFFHDSCFLINGIEEFYIRVLLKDHAGVGKKCKYRGLQLPRLRSTYEMLEYFFVAQMHTVKSTYRNGSEMLFIVFRNALDCYH